MRVGSLFSGIGGMDLGLERAGMEIVWQVEIDEFCRAVMAKHWPDVERFGDVKECGAHNLKPVDLVCGGFPCQPVSCAGQRKGKADERWLWPEFHRIICELRPRWVLVENVPGLLSIDAGRLFGGILRDLAESGYDVEWDSIPAAALGAPHIRYRIFLVAYADTNRCRSGDWRGLIPDCQRNSASSLRQAQQQSGSSDPSLMADTASRRRGRWRQQPKGGEGTGSVADDDGSGCSDVQGHCAAAKPHRRLVFGADDRRPAGQWSPEPDVDRVADGVPARVDRLRALGNAVVPQVAEWIGRGIMDAAATAR